MQTISVNCGGAIDNGPEDFENATAGTEQPDHVFVVFFRDGRRSAGGKLGKQRFNICAAFAEQRYRDLCPLPFFVWNNW